MFRGDQQRPQGDLRGSARHGIAFQAHNLIIHAMFLRRAQLASLGSGLLLISAPGALL